MKTLKEILKPMLLVAVGVNASTFMIGSSIGMTEASILSLVSAVLCMIGYTNLTSQDDGGE